MLVHSGSPVVTARAVVLPLAQSWVNRGRVAPRHRIGDVKAIHKLHFHIHTVLVM